ncbi:MULTISPECIES: outer membrane channel protein TolC [Vibrio]|uniref:Outer membrane channel protein TolC n=1 Tax=Vibrio mediterranei TaxID=689 RepID=A0A3G4VGB0_9VIBR|nr:MULTISPECIES: outer membrane channel protein TolC [Vibrio]AYV23836.1 outer membrane channel protein TolC [Vibrio mediterranei]EDL54888.1 outer membrane channel precursor protein [Vibrio mediterranei AK1]MCG9661017.1 outer membrane channel protein TolC [Vibrio mediterranei]MCG9663433.1 outer membrane channel protein TolC [Vibrio mediterranei]MCG9787919.1 outer membrane channel protein TolC [Vibrio mediterranei]
MKNTFKITPLILLAIASSVKADTLTEIYDLAKQNDPQLLKASAQRDSAFEAINSTRSALLPQIDLTAGYAYQDSDRHTTDGSTTDLSLGLSQSIYDRSSWIALTISEKSAREADARYASTQQQVIYNVAEAYFNVLRAEDDLRFIQAEKQAVAKQLMQTEQRFDVGIAPITDVQDARAQYDSVLAQEIQAKNNVENEYEELRAITGQQASNLAVLDTARFSTSLPSKNADQLVAQATNENLDLLANRIQKDVAKEQISLAQSGHLPTISLTSNYSYTKNYNEPNDPVTGAQMDDDENLFNLGISIDLPVYSGGRITSEAKQAEYQFVSASQDLESTFREVQKDVRAINNNIRSSIGSIQAYKQSVISAESALTATQEGFNVGTRTIVDVLESTQNVYQANKNLSDARYQYILSQVQLKQAIGTLSEQDIVDINAGLKKVN